MNADEGDGAAQALRSPVQSADDWFARHCRCVDCFQQSVETSESDWHCVHCDARFPVVDGIPVLTRADNSLFPRDELAAALDVQRAAPRATYRRRLPVPALSANLSAERMLARFAAEVGGTDTAPARVLVVGAGSQRESLRALLNADDSMMLVHCDIDTSSDSDFLADAHALPLVDNSVDGVITTAVLEHVMYPEAVAGEIARVCRPGALLYSELPFIQQVHEAAYDFTRFTHSGHRRLFNHFAEIDSGMVAGPGTALAWSVEHLALSLMPQASLRLVAKALVRYGFFWLKYLDRLLANRPAALDAASCTYFYGRLAEERRSDVDIIEAYAGSGGAAGPSSGRRAT